MGIYLIICSDIDDMQDSDMCGLTYSALKQVEDHVSCQTGKKETVYFEAEAWNMNSM